MEVADILLDHPLLDGAPEVSYAPTLDFQNSIAGLAMVFVVSARGTRDISLTHQLIRTAECLTP